MMFRTSLLIFVLKRIGDSSRAFILKAICFVAVTIFFAGFKSDTDNDPRFICWELFSIQPKDSARKRMPEGVRPYIVIQDTLVDGFSGCNIFSAKSILKRDAIELKWLETSYAKCEDEHWVEDAIFGAMLKAKIRYHVWSDSLIVFGKDNTVLTFFVSTTGPCAD